MSQETVKDRAVTVEEARKIILDLPLKTLQSERIPIEEAYHRILSEDIYSQENLPGFKRSTMDGYAVCSADTFGASESLPVYLNIKGTIKMGMPAEIKINRGEAAEIPTGGMLPEGTDAVVMYEHTTRISDALVEILKPVAPGENIVMEDEDVRAGQVVLRKGHRLRAHDIGALAGIGITEVNVYKKPVVSIISTGDEIVPPAEPLSPGQVRDINSYNLYGLINQHGGVAVKKGIIRDEYSILRRVVEEALNDSNMVLITGGSSVGTRDYVSRIIDELGAPGVLFHRVTIKPGKPLIGGRINNTPVFGLPGHPVAVTVCFDNFVLPLLRRLTGENTRAYLPDSRTVKARVTHNLSSPIGREDHVRVKIEQRNGSLWAIPILGKSGLITTLVEADGIIVIPQHSSGIYEGDEVDVRLF
ncbi:MAG: molybdopterin molybdotransferase MoeA [Nitrospirae bacterium]|nr:molybdopterin molybdotransferase MoeA [Nitrospirota bacterium]